MCEDQLLYLPERKSELVATLQYAKRLAAPRANHDAFIKFNDAAHLRPAPKIALARTHNAQVTFTVSPGARQTHVSLAKGGATVAVVVAGCEGVPSSVVREREARLKASLKRKAKQAERDRRHRAVMAEQRAAEREVARKARIAAKKQAKIDAKEAAADKKAIKLAKSKAKAAGVAYVAPKKKKKKKKAVAVTAAATPVSAKVRAQRRCVIVGVLSYAPPPTAAVVLCLACSPPPASVPPPRLGPLSQPRNEPRRAARDRLAASNAIDSASACRGGHCCLDRGDEEEEEEAHRDAPPRDVRLLGKCWG